MTAETEEMRRQRRSRRALFDGVAGQYQASRPGYPAELAEFITGTAGLRPGSAVLEVGCGTGQLTGLLAGCGFAVTAIDLGPAMIVTARQRPGCSRVSFAAVTFEDLDEPARSFDLVISATAFHWIDPDVKFIKPARLLRPGGWLALVSTGERYDSPLDSELEDMWVARSGEGRGWAARPDPATDMTGSEGLFGPPVTWSHNQRTVVPTEAVISVETTRATFLSWPVDVQRGFVSELRAHLRSMPDVPVTRRSSVRMAQAMPPR